MSPKKPAGRFPEVPSWVSALLAAFLAFVATWSALRVTVASLQSDVADLKNLVQTVAVLDARSKAQDAELGKVNAILDETRARQIQILERLSTLEGKRR